MSSSDTFRRAEPQPAPAGSETESSIFAAALRVFARKGYGGARMQEIADEARINRALLHYYFRSKRHLYEAVFAHLFEQYMRSFEAVLEPGRPLRETLHRFIDHYIDYVRDHQDMARLMVSENLTGGSLLGEHLAAAFEREGSPLKFMEEAILSARASGEIRPADPKQTMLTLISACVFFFITLPTVQVLNPEARDDFEAFVQARKKHVFEVLYYGLSCREEAT